MNEPIPKMKSAGSNIEGLMQRMSGVLYSGSVEADRKFIININ